MGARNGEKSRKRLDKWPLVKTAHEGLISGQIGITNSHYPCEN